MPETGALKLWGRGALTGMTRTGKTTLARVLLSKERRVLVIDPKWCFKPLREGGRKYTITDDPEQVGKILRREHVIFRLLLDKDVKRAAEWLGPEAKDGASDLHSFFYRDVRMGRAKEYVLDLGD